jgi:hypothetical protein
VADKMAARRGVKIRQMSFADWDAEVLRTLEVYNDAWEKNWGFVPLGDKEYLHIAKDLKMVLHPDFAILAEVDGKPAAFVLTIQNVNPILKKLDGKLFPFGILRLIWDLKVRKKIDSGRLILLGIKAPYRGQGIDSLLFLATHRAAVKQGWKSGEIGWTLEDNHRVNSAIKAMGGFQVATYRVYSKPSDRLALRACGLHGPSGLRASRPGQRASRPFGPAGSPSGLRGRITPGGVFGVGERLRPVV